MVPVIEGDRRRSLLMNPSWDQRLEGGAERQTHNRSKGTGGGVSMLEMDVVVVATEMWGEL